MTGVSDASDPASRGWTIPAAAALAVLEIVVLSTILVQRHTHAAPYFIACLAVKIPFCVLLMRRSPGAWMALILWEGTGLYAAFIAPRVPGVLRGVEGSVAASVLVLLAVSLPLFPRARLEFPER